ncbi:MAG TPA: ABC transporter ATP-binding protein [Pyrinomonadaceae bacterium]|nr:ABC transporter ATP-binding protein [Pyrinomonadaceae bacterium]
MKLIITAENLAKQYRIGTRQEYSLRDVLAETLSAPIQRLRRRTNGNTIWALKNINFKIAQGEVVGIVGRNGAGKSTLLKVLSRITEPTRGCVKLYGRVGSLLEVGTGFHPELTGRENIFLNGAILGMTRREISRKFDEIVSFAEIERFIETPVKHYSSGMYTRLAFAVAAHLEPEILLVDEVLAVGDASFQKKCLGKMSEIAGEGRTVLFVSHNMAAVSQLCTRAMLVADGQIQRAGPTQEVVAEYFKAGSEGAGETIWEDPKRAPGNDRIRLHAIRILCKGTVTSEVDIDQEVSVEVDFWNYEPGARNLCVSINLQNATGITVLSTANTPAANLLQDEEWFDRSHEAGLFRSTCTLPANFLNDGVYYITAHVLSLGPVTIEAEAAQVLCFNVLDTGAMREAGVGSKWDGVVRVRLPWRTSLLQPLNGNSARRDGR